MHLQPNLILKETKRRGRIWQKTRAKILDW